MENKTYKVELTDDAIKNMMDIYIDHKKMVVEMENEHSDEEGLYEDADYNFHKGCCETAECWMRLIGISPSCNYITENI